MRKLISIYLFLLGTLSGFGQSAGEGKKWIEAYVKTLGETGVSLSKGHQYYIHAKVTTVPAKDSPYSQTSYTAQDMEIKIWMTKDIMFYESAYVSIYQDSKDVFTVVHPRKIIVHAKPQATTKEASQEAVAKVFSSMQQELVQNCTESAVRDTVYEGKKAKIIELQPHAKLQESHRLRKLIYYYIPTEKMVVRQRMEFTKGHPYQRQDITYHEQNLNYKGKIANSAAGCLFESSSKLRSRFKGYQIENE